MIKMSFAVYRRPELTREAFLAYWRDVHGPLIARHAELLRIRRYVQLHGIEGPLVEQMVRTRGCAPAHDGVAQVWWDSEQDRMEALQTPEAQAAIAEIKADEDRFVDMSRSSPVFGVEHVVVG
jgi:uncharacterized protein (TIGR02118 family)